MIPSNVRSVPAESPQKTDVTTGCDVHRPMSQQTLTVMRCIHRNWCSWSAVMIQMRESTKVRIVH